MENLMVLTKDGAEIARVQGWERGRALAQELADERREAVELAAEGVREDEGRGEWFEPTEEGL